MAAAFAGAVGIVAVAGLVAPSEAERGTRRPISSGGRL